jgi:hypothetical protein
VNLEEKKSGAAGGHEGEAAVPTTNDPFRVFSSLAGLNAAKGGTYFHVSKKHVRSQGKEAKQRTHREKSILHSSVSSCQGMLSITPSVLKYKIF